MHPSDGTLRRSLDEPVAADAASRAHVASCARCAGRLQRMSTDATAVQALLASNDPVVDVAAARSRLSGSEAAGAGATTQRSAKPLRTRSARTSRVLTGVAVAGLASVLLVATGAAQDFLSLFTPTQLAAVPVTAADVRSLAGLTSYGTVNGGPTIAYQAEPDAAAAGAAAGISAPVVADLPGRDLSGGEVRRHLGWCRGVHLQRGPREGGGCPSRGAVAGNAGRAGRRHPVHPDLARRGGLLRGGSRNPPPRWHRANRLSSGRGGVKGADGDIHRCDRQATRDLPAERARSFPAGCGVGDSRDRRSRRDHPRADPCRPRHRFDGEINGARGLLIGDATGLGSAVVWQHNGVVYAVAGTMTSNQVLGIARTTH